MSALQIVCAVIALGMAAVGTALLVRAVLSIVATFKLGRPEYRGDNKVARTRTLLREFLGHTRMSRIRIVSAAHWVTMVSFGFLFLTLVTAFGQIFSPHWVIPFLGHFFVYEWITDILTVTGIVGIITLMAVRRKNHPATAKGEQGRYSRFFGSNFWQAYYVELTILGVMLCILTLRGLEYALQSKSGDVNAILHYPLTFPIGDAFGGMSEHSLEQLVVVIATLKIVISFAWMITVSLNTTMGVAWHRFLAFFNIFFKRHADGATSLGALQPMAGPDGKPIDFDNLDELMGGDEDAEDGAEPAEPVLGVGKAEDFTWKGLLDFSTCTECGRCQSQCPAWNTEKPLSPKLLMMTLRDHSHAKNTALAGVGADAKPGEPAGYAEGKGVLGQTLIGSTGYDLDAPLGAYDPLGLAEAGVVVDEDVLWSCTTCGACVEQCPVDIEHVDHIVDMRRHQVLLESAFPSELGGLFKNLENKQNPWGMSARARMDWAKDLPFDVKVIGGSGANAVESAKEVDWLFWVGCAGAYEDRAKKTTRAVAELLHTAGVEFAVLGDGEACTGDSARRAGNEMLFQMLAQQNVETLNSSEATKIVVTCAHCFNTIKNEYPQVGGNYEVVHHTQLLNRLVREKKLTPVARPDEADTSGAASTAPSVTYHDPCYLGRHNGVYAPPRELLGALPGVEYKEMERSGETSFCCGAGGARMWMEEKLGSRINVNRTVEAVATGADRIAIGCPFCRVMMTDGLTAEQSDGRAREEVEVVDVANMLLAAVKRGA
ncbi:heterodisulfide reductase-related iron-sulfur binding cluster [Dermacoccaceae bacterium W4C1]